MGHLICGVDFGTSNTVVQVYDTDTQTVLPSNGSFQNSIESVIYFPHGERENFYLGKEAILQYVESGMTGRFIKSIKSAMPEPALGQISVHGKRVKIETLVSYFLKHIKDLCEAHYNQPISHVVLGRPSQYSPDSGKDKLAETRLVKAAKMAGFTHTRVVKEPIAAAIEYRRNIDNSKKVFVGDFGAGTSDFCVMAVNPSATTDVRFEDEVIGTSGLKMGGDDFDAAIMWDKLVPYFGYGAEYESFNKWLPIPVHIFRTICSWEKLSLLRRVDIQNSLKTFHHSTNEKEKIARLLTLINKNLGFAVIKAVESAKIRLSDHDAASIIYAEHDIDIDRLVKAEEMAGMLETQVAKLEERILGFMKSARTSFDDIDVVFMTGGSSLVHPVRDLMIRRFGEDKIQVGDAFKSVAYGLAASARDVF